MKNFFIKEEFSFFVLLYTFIKKDTILTLIYIVMKISHIEHLRTISGKQPVSI